MPHTPRRLGLPVALLAVVLAGCSADCKYGGRRPTVCRTQRRHSKRGRNRVCEHGQSSGLRNAESRDRRLGLRRRCGGDVQGPPVPFGLVPGRVGTQDPTVTPSGGSEGGGADKVLYLTFDDGPSKYTPEMLDLLATTGAKATFFVIGQQAAEQPEMLKRIAGAGHAIGNHTCGPSRTREAERPRGHRSTRPHHRGCGCGDSDRWLHAAAVRAHRRPGCGHRTRAASATDPVDAHAEDWNQPPVESMIEDLRAGTRSPARYSCSTMVGAAGRTRWPPSRQCCRSGRARATGWRPSGLHQTCQ